MEVMRVGRGARWMAEGKARLRLLSISCLDTIMPVAKSNSGCAHDQSLAARRVQVDFIQASTAELRRSPRLSW
jgi:hypothetical protein